MSHNSLENYYRTMFGLVNNMKYSLTEVENMIVYEKDIFIGFMLEKASKEK